jgi:hypothetical protein
LTLASGRAIGLDMRIVGAGLVVKGVIRRQSGGAVVASGTRLPAALDGQRRIEKFVIFGDGVQVAAGITCV